MTNGTLSIIISTAIIFLLFFIWHFLLSIYEVKYKYDFHPEKLLVNHEYTIECIGLNSLGWQINFRDLSCNYKIESGSEFIKIINPLKINAFSFQVIQQGNIIIHMDSKYALNPSKLLLSTMEK